MNDATKTIIAVVAAAALAGLALVTRPRPVTSDSFSDQGQAFYPDFNDPAAARSLEVVAFDAERAEYKPFKVEFDGRRWVIPSHHGYPADAAQKMAEAASAFLGLSKEVVVTDRAADHQALGVLDPADEAAPLSGRGTRVTLKDESGRVLSDLILGEKAPDPGTTTPSASRRYVRTPGKSRVYIANLDKTFSTRFADWVETDLLRIAAGSGGAVGDAPDVWKIGVDRYSIDEKSGSQTDVQSVTMERANKHLPGHTSASPITPEWTVTADPGGSPAEGEQVRTQRITDLVTALKDLRIVGVRPKPKNLVALFSGERTSPVNMADLLSLQSRGFYTTQDGHLLANEGQLTVTADDGVVYTLWFGEVLFGNDEEISAGVEPAATGEDAAPPADSAAAQTPPAGQESRYLFITVDFDPTVIPEPVAPGPIAAASPAPPAESAPADGSTPDGAPADQPAAPAPDSSAATESSPASAPDPEAVKEYERFKKAREDSLAEGRKRADALKKRYADWYYVIDAASFAKLRPTRDELIEPVPPPGADAPAPLVPSDPQ